MVEECIDTDSDGDTVVLWKIPRISSVTEKFKEKGFICRKY